MRGYRVDIIASGRSQEHTSGYVVAIDAYLQIGDIKGESQDDKHRNRIEDLRDR
jgi:hypothetical protein